MQFYLLSRYAGCSLTIEDKGLFFFFFRENEITELGSTLFYTEIYKVTLQFD